MALVIRRERPFEDLFDLSRDFDRMLSRFAGTWGTPGERQARGMIGMPPVDAWVDKKENKYRLSVAVPGIDPKDIQLNVQGNLLTLSGEYQEKEERKEADYLERELYFGRVERTITLPEGVDTDKLTAEYNNGILEISAPLSSAATPKRVEIKSLPKAKTAAG